MRYIRLAASLSLGLVMMALSTITSMAAADGIFASLHTSKGVITARLFYKRAPISVMNFIGLAEGTVKWRSSEDKEFAKTPLYQGLTFHAVKDFMVQTGDPTGTGRGGPGYLFDDEFHPQLTHARAGVLSMATRGRNTNGSQFIITTKPAPWLDRHKTVFGEVIKGKDVAARIVKGDALEKIVIARVGKDAEGFNPARAHALAKEVNAALMEAAKKTIPEATSPLDPVRLPVKGQALVSPADFDFIVIAHSEMKDVKKLGRVFYYDQKGALDIAGKLVRIARSKDTDFAALIAKYSDMKRNSTSRGVKDSPFAPAALKTIFRLKPGQISGPVDMPTGVYIFRRLEPTG